MCDGIFKLKTPRLKENGDPAVEAGHMKKWTRLSTPVQPGSGFNHPTPPNLSIEGSHLPPENMAECPLGCQKPMLSSRLLLAQSEAGECLLAELTRQISGCWTDPRALENRERRKSSHHSCRNPQPSLPLRSQALGRHQKTSQLGI